LNASAGVLTLSRLGSHALADTAAEETSCFDLWLHHAQNDLQRFAAMKLLLLSIMAQRRSSQHVAAGHSPEWALNDLRSSFVCVMDAATATGGTRTWMAAQ
jgi:hypothetical protein